ncbi:hypothetical protein DYH09_19435, partial [bacterium CPR1]|nr:hypothetical protein [bacterium CPR1]
GVFGLLIGIGFKLSAVPIHFWCPDVFEGASIEITTFLSVASKAGAIALLVRIMMTLGHFSAGEDASRVLVGIGSFVGLVGVVTATWGNLAAYFQTNVKRLLAYSSIAHAGYMIMLAGLLTAAMDRAQPTAVAYALLFYLIVYAFMNMGAFAIVLFLESRLQRPVVLDDLNGLARWEPGLAAILSLCLLSLAGLPPAGGLLAKFFLFGAGLKGAGVVVATGVVGSLLGVYYYLNPIGRMYMREGDDPRLPSTPWAFNLALVVVVLGLLTCGLYPQPMLDWAAFAGQALEQAAGAGPAVTR